MYNRKRQAFQGTARIVGEVERAIESSRLASSSLSTPFVAPAFSCRLLASLQLVWRNKLPPGQNLNPTQCSYN